MNTSQVSNENTLLIKVPIIITLYFRIIKILATTVGETGVADFSYEAWNAVSAPGGTPREIVQRLNAEVVRVVALAEVRERLGALGYEPASLSSADFTALVAADFQRFGRLAREIGLRADQ